MRAAEGQVCMMQGWTVAMEVVGLQGVVWEGEAQPATQDVLSTTEMDKSATEDRTHRAR